MLSRSVSESSPQSSTSSKTMPRREPPRRAFCGRRVTPVRTYPTATAFLSLLPTRTPGCVVLDLRLPGVSGLDLQRALSEPKTRCRWCS